MARAERERVANEEKHRRLQVEATRVELVKADTAQLEQLAEQAKAAAQAEMQKANEAKKAQTQSAKVAAIAPPAPQAGGLTAEQRTLAMPIEAELRRIGCYPGANPIGTAGRTSRRR